jgi:hypothetical protein
VTIAWGEFLLVVVASLLAACLVVTTFSLALRLGDGEAAWRRPVSVVLYVVCGAAVAFGIYLIVPALHAFGS